MEAIPVECFEEDVATAKSMGAMALFSEVWQQGSCGKNG